MAPGRRQESLYRAFGCNTPAASTSDSEGAPPVAVINESLAKQLFGTTDVLGRRFAIALGAKSPVLEIIGVSADAKYMSLRRPAPPTFYVSYRQRAAFGSTFVVRTTLEPTAITEQVREAIRALDPELPISNLRTQREQIDLSLQRERLFAQLATLLGGVAVLLAMIGLYGLLAYSVTRRTPELDCGWHSGPKRHGAWMVLKQSLVLVGAGLALGVPAAIGGIASWSSLLYEISPSSPLTLMTAPESCSRCRCCRLHPAHRASRVDPAIALRAE